MKISIYLVAIVIFSFQSKTQAQEIQYGAEFEKKSKTYMTFLGEQNNIKYAFGLDGSKNIIYRFDENLNLTAKKNLIPNKKDLHYIKFFNISESGISVIKFLPKGDGMEIFHEVLDLKTLENTSEMKSIYSKKLDVSAMLERDIFKAFIYNGNFQVLTSPNQKRVVFLIHLIEEENRNSLVILESNLSFEILNETVIELSSEYSTSLFEEATLSNNGDIFVKQTEGQNFDIQDFSKKNYVKSLLDT